MKKVKSLSDVKTREQSGRDTTLRFEYQHRFAAEASLQILEDNGTVCVFCDYHDDYVVQRNDTFGEKFEFVQVKTNKKEKHEWDVAEVFGVNLKTTPKTKPPKSFAGKIFCHELNFKDQCSDVSILTNVFFIDDIENLLNDVKASSQISDLQGASKDWFQKIATAYEQSFDKVNPQVIFSFLKKLKLRSNSGLLVDEGTHAAIFLKKIYDYSEVTLNHPEAVTIYQNLITKVRQRSMSEIPQNITPIQLMANAGIVLDDLLSILSISKSGYEILRRNGDPKALRNTTKLKRFIEELGGDMQMMDVACEAKVEWDNWILKNRHEIGSLDLALLTKNCGDILKTQNNVRRSLIELQNEFESISSRFSGKVNYSMSKDLVFGLFLSLIVKGEK